MEYKASLCPGCAQPKHESFSPASDDRYDVTVLQCHSCAARDRRSWIRNSDREKDSIPEFGTFYVVTPEDDRKT